VPNEDDHFRDLNAKLDQLRTSLIELRQLLSAHTARELSLPATLESANKNLHSIKTLALLLQAESAALQTRLERAVRETWEQKAKRAGATARPEILAGCLKSIWEKTSYQRFEVILMDNETTDECSLQLMEQYPVRRILRALDFTRFRLALLMFEYQYLSANDKWQPIRAAGNARIRLQGSARGRCDCVAETVTRSERSKRSSGPANTDGEGNCKDLLIEMPS
jgi:hypothetical protein